MAKTTKKRAAPTTWEQFCEALDARYAALSPGWALHAEEDLARLAVIDAQEGRVERAFERLAAIGSVTRRALAACELALVLHDLGDAPHAANALQTALRLADADHHETARAAVFGQLAFTLERLGQHEDAARWASRAREFVDASNNPGETVRALARYLLTRGAIDEATELVMRRGLSSTMAFQHGYVEAFTRALVALRAWPQLIALGRAQENFHEERNALRRAIPAMLAAGEADALLDEIGAMSAYRSGLLNDVADEAERLGMPAVVRRAVEIEFERGAPWNDTPVVFLKWLAPLDEERARRELARLEAIWFEGARAFAASAGRDWLNDEFVRAFARLRILDRAVALIEGTGALSRYAVLVRALHRDGRAQARDVMLDRMASQARAQTPDEAAKTLLAAAACATACGLRARAKALVDEVFAAVSSKSVTDKNLAMEAVAAYLAIDDVASAWVAYRKVNGKYRKEEALRTLLAWSGAHDDPATALDALTRYVKERPDDGNPLRHGLDAFEASRVARGVRPLVNVF